MNGRLYFVYMRKTSVCRALGFLKSGAKSFEGEEDQGLRLQREREPSFYYDGERSRPI